tara:strand:+ start:1138 stop:2556 length:1419 start_codon:yes stop_codon:yes gene_type:complete
MLSNLRNFAKTKIAGVFIVIIIIPFVFWGMGSVFNSGNTNNIAKINNKNISTQDFMDYLNKSGISQSVIKDNIERNIINELLSGLVSTTILDLEIEDIDISFSDNLLTKKIKSNKNFIDDNGNFKRTSYEKFLLENNLSAPGYEIRLKKNVLQKQLFDYIGAGTVSPKFMVEKTFYEQNRSINVEYIELDKVYKKKDEFNNDEIKKFFNENIEKLKQDFIDFSYVEITPQNLIGINDFNESFFNKIDEIENKISKNIEFKNIINDLDLKPIQIKDFTNLASSKIIEKKIFELRDNKMDIFEDKDKFILFNIENIKNKNPNLNESHVKEKIINLLLKKNKRELSERLLSEINNQTFNKTAFDKLGKKFVKKIKLKSINDNELFQIDSLKIIYSLPENSFSLITDNFAKIYVAQIKDFQLNKEITNKKEFTKIEKIENSKERNRILQSYDFLLNNKYNVTLNQKTVNRVENYFK